MPTGNNPEFAQDAIQKAAEKIQDMGALKKEMSELKSTLPTTFGERLVGLSFNPSNDDKVSKAKKLCAALADLVQDHYSEPRERTNLEAQLYDHTIGEILNAQMNVVKLLTLKY